MTLFLLALHFAAIPLQMNGADEKVGSEEMSESFAYKKKRKEKKFQALMKCRFLPKYTL